MEYSFLDKLNIKVSKLGFGAMRFPKNKDIIDQEKVNKMIKAAYDGGINYYDTAYVYDKCASEKALGIALKPFPRESFFVADKMPFWLVESQEDMDRIFNETLENIGVEYIDFYLMHSLDVGNVEIMEKLNGIAWAIEKKKQGLIKNLGFSIHDDVSLLNKVLKMYDWDFVQIQYNYMDILDNPGDAGYKVLVDNNIPIMIMEPLKGGMLASIPDALREPFDRLGKDSSAKFSFRWIAEKKGIATILSGMNEVQQVTENIEIFSDLKPLNKEEIKAIAKVRDNINSRQKVKCTGCSYCMPCPMGVNIPRNFKAWNNKALNGLSENWISTSEVDYENLDKCVGCRLCVKLCPQKIEIPDKIRELINENV